MITQGDQITILIIRQSRQVSSVGFLFFRLDTTLGKPLHVLTRDKERTTVFSKLASMENQMRDLDRKMDQILVLLHTQHQETRKQH